MNLRVLLLLAALAISGNAFAFSNGLYLGNSLANYPSEKGGEVSLDGKTIGYLFDSNMATDCPTSFRVLIGIDNRSGSYSDSDVSADINTNFLLVNPSLLLGNANRYLRVFGGLDVKYAFTVGGMGSGSDTKGSGTIFSFGPVVGLNYSPWDNWTIGFSLGYSYSKADLLFTTSDGRFFVSGSGNELYSGIHISYRYDEDFGSGKFRWWP